MSEFYKDAANIGQGGTYQTPEQRYDAEHGKHQEEPPEDLPEDTKLPTGNMPQGPDPDPFKLGPTSPGSR